MPALRWGQDLASQGPERVGWLCMGTLLFPKVVREMSEGNPTAGEDEETSLGLVTEQARSPLRFSQ